MIVGLTDIDLNALSILTFINFYVKWILLASSLLQGED